MPCKCKTTVIKTNYCPDCGAKISAASKRYPAEKLGTVAIKTPEFRCPKKGEYFLSGAIPMAYLAPNDLSTPYWIMQIVT